MRTIYVLNYQDGVCYSFKLHDDVQDEEEIEVRLQHAGIPLSECYWMSSDIHDVEDGGEL